MPRLLIVHHTPSPHLQEMFEAVLAGATDPEIQGVEVVRRPALRCRLSTCLKRTAICSAPRPTSATFRGALKHGVRPVGTISCSTPPVGDRSASTSTATKAPRERSGVIAAITTGLGWEQAAATVVVMGKPTKADIDACWNLGATVAAQPMEE